MGRERILKVRKCKYCGKEFVTLSSRQCCSRECAAEWKSNLDGKYTLCWECKKSTTAECSWSDDFTPVEGWVATPTTIRAGGTGAERDEPSYIVHKCPLFEQG